MLKKYYRTILVLVLLIVWFGLFYLQFERPFAARIAINVTPSLLLTNLKYLLFSLGWICIPMLLFIALKGRYFCWKICPVGIMQDLLPSFVKLKKTNLNKYLLIFLISASFFSLNLIAMLDPLVTFNRFLVMLNLRLISAVVFLIPILIIFFLNLTGKRFWCHKLCPLGALVDWIVLIKQKIINRKTAKFDIERRWFLLSLGLGLAAGSGLRFQNTRKSNLYNRLLRPPGVYDEDKFTDKCIRCGSCIGVCLTGTLRASFLEGGWEGIFTPRLVPVVAECDEFCNKCGEACPTQAIPNLPLEVKREARIGTAKVDKTKCIAWSQNKLCLVCKEHCPYLAIGTEKNINDISSPIVIPDLCRGCGFCEKTCQVHPDSAIKVYRRS